MNIDTAELRKLAEAAPEGPWFGPEYAPGTSYVFDVDLGSLLHYESIETEQDACLRYVAAANPAVVLALLAEIDGLTAQHGRDSTELRRLCQARDDARRERDQLKADNEALRKDAERYQWLIRRISKSQYYFLGAQLTSNTVEGVGAAVDAAMAKEVQP